MEFKGVAIPQTYKMESFGRIVNDFLQFTIVAKLSILDICVEAVEFCQFQTEPFTNVL